MSDDVESDEPERVLLTDEDEYLFRQVLLPLRDGRPSWEAFKGRKDEVWQVSVDREARCPSAEEAYTRYTAGGARSNGVVATSVGALSDQLVVTYEDELEDNPAHCMYDLATLSSGGSVSHSVRERICVRLYELSLTYDKHPPYLPANP